MLNKSKQVLLRQPTLLCYVALQWRELFKLNYHAVIKSLKKESESPEEIKQSLDVAYMANLFHHISRLKH